MAIRITVAPGELIDKITILEIKFERISAPKKLENVKHELRVLRQEYATSVTATEELQDLTSRLKKANEALWEIEDDIRDCERGQNFGTKFIELARSVYKVNDQRAAVKRQINELLNSDIFEEKSYAAY